jgi:hypothetical protein
MMGAGLGRQLGRCDGDNAPGMLVSDCLDTFANTCSDVCNDSELYGKILSAYNHLWDLIEANSAQLSSEVWSWNYNDGYQATPLGTFVPTESNIRQLWSLTFLAIKRQTFGPGVNSTGGNGIGRNGTSGNGTRGGPTQFEGVAPRNTVGALLAVLTAAAWLFL